MTKTLTLVPETEADPDYNEVFDEDVERIAEEMGCEVELADDMTLQIDLDNEDDFALFLDQHRRLSRMGLVGGWTERPSRNGNRHIIVDLFHETSVKERILLQSLLGSDRVRELLNLRRHEAGIENPIRLFKPVESGR